MKTIKNLWLYIALGISALILVGMSLPWADALDLYSFNIGIVTYRGWSLIWFAIPILVVMAAFIVPFWKQDKKQWLWGALGLGVVALIPLVIFGVNILRKANELFFTTVPMFGYWLTLLGVIALVVISALTLFKKTSAV